MSEYRDSKGKLIDFSSEPGCSFGEVLAVKIDGRMERIESNLGDARVEIQKIISELGNNKEQTTAVCTALHEALAEMHLNLKALAVLTKKEETLNTKIAEVEKQVNAFKAVFKFCAWTIGVLIAAASALIGIIKHRGGV